VLKAISPGEYVITLDERGRLVTSEQMAELLAQAGEQGSPCLTFCIGGPFGHGPQVAARANDSISLSKCVMNHAVAHVVLAEQLYRAWTILRNEPYHH
jgi:23S rRNA (pseudouridine1915-N3)-methyltransferase